jgi:hypothetical protein
MTLGYIISMMFYLVSVLFSFFVVAGQAMYNKAVNDASFELTPSFLFSKKLIDMITEPIFLCGVLLFLGATAVSFWMYTQYEFDNIQAATVSMILIFTYLINYWFFQGSIALHNVIGFLIIVAGVLVATGALTSST